MSPAATPTTPTTPTTQKRVFTRADIRPHQANLGVIATPVLPLVPGVMAKAAPRTAAQLFRCGGAMYRTRWNGRECFMPSPALYRHFSGPLALTRGLAFLAECKRDASLRRIVEGFGIDLGEWAEQIEIAQRDREIWA